MTTLKAGTRVLTSTLVGPRFDEVWDTHAKIARWTARMGSREALPGYHPVRFESGGIMMVPESAIRVVDNRPGFAA
jgi:hypothetical protein